ncbi:YkyA family protein [Ectobacillus panaciterrae]|uniref:YkyA family protein n=1 Tax=Ectobacillus panaciterrae TaxID=363872 RepID=UPI00048C0D79|nr:YkyA family protein [Ectobacillus panaciterrae]
MFKYKIAVLAIFVLALTGCGPKPEEELYNIFEDAAKQEKGMFQETSKLESLEKKNKELYSKILQEGKEDNQPVKALIDEGIQSAKEREQALSKEHDMLKLAQDKMKDANQHMKDFKDEKLEKQAEKVESTYKERYAAFQNMHNSYKKALEAEKNLYDMLQKKNEKLKTISDQVKEVNKLYDDVQSQNEKFNQYTKQYNEEKIQFYKLAKFKIKEGK